MNGYRRFIAYVYEYRNGRKAENCGFIKLEVRDGKCTMEIHLHEEKQMEHCSIYGFIRKEGLILGIWLGSLQISRDPAVNVLETDAGNMGDAGISLDQLCGMILETDTGAFMGTQWDDLPIRPDHFQKLEKKEQTGQKERALAEISERKQESEKRENEQQDNEQQKNEKQDNEQQKNKKQDNEQQKNEKQDNEQQKNKKQDNEQQKNEKQDNEQQKNEKQENEQQQKVEARKESKGGELQAESIQEEAEENPMLFPDCDQCWRICPGDLRQICRKNCVYCNNRFLRHGYSQFGYILLCRQSDGQYILGVPGIYDQQERFMAEMFGFPWFKEWPLPGIKNGKSGYWYRICAPCEMLLDSRR